MTQRIKVLHTADWHLGHTLVDVPRDAEHAAFLAWLLDEIERERPDALIHAGDVFDSANPPASAQAAWYGFLGEAWSRRPGLQVLAIAGNHDSPSRLMAPGPLFGSRGRVIGELPRTAAGALDLERLLVPLRSQDGGIAAWCAAVPYLRVSDLAPPASSGGERDPIIDGVRAVYAEATAALRARRAPGQAMLATGHLYMAGTTLSALSERKILGGHRHPLPAEVFADDLAYVALGHLHRPQSVGGRDAVRYPGSPIALSFPEATHGHGILLVTLEGERAVEVRPLEAPRSRELLRLPEGGAAPIEDVLACLRALPSRSEVGKALPGEGKPLPEPLRLKALDRIPLVEIRVRQAAPDPFLRKKVEDALEGKDVRLVRLAVETPAGAGPLADQAPRASLHDLPPEEVFRRRYARDHGPLEPARDLLEAFHSVLEAAAHGDLAGGPS